MKLLIDASQLNRPGLVDQLKEVFEHHKGEADVHLEIDNGNGEPKNQIKLGDDYRVRPSSGLRAELDHLLGAEALAA